MFFVCLVIFLVHLLRAPTPDPRQMTQLYVIGVWGRGAQTGNSLKRGVYVCERVACVMERRRMLAGQIRGSECTAASAAARILDWVLSRFCLGFVSVLSRPASPKLPITQRVALSVFYTDNATRWVIGSLWEMGGVHNVFPQCVSTV